MPFPTFRDDETGGGETSGWISVEVDDRNVEPASEWVERCAEAHSSKKSIAVPLSPYLEIQFSVTTSKH